jgi:hypothetical protein
LASQLECLDLGSWVFLFLPVFAAPTKSTLDTVRTFGTFDSVGTFGIQNVSILVERTTISHACTIVLVAMCACAFRFSLIVFDDSPSFVIQIFA